MGGESEDSCVAMPRGVVVARDLHKRYGDSDVVGGISFCVKEGECFGLLGPNGAGKTTTISMILGHCRISSGELEVFGLPIASNALRVREDCGVVSQTDDLDPDFTVEENLQIYASYYRVDGTLVADRVRELLEFTHLQHRAGMKVDQLSGGMKRRLSVARSLINDPKLIVLDEPTTGLDPQARHLIWERLGGLKKQNKTLILTTHYMEEAERLCDRLIIIDEGVILAAGSPRSLIEEYVESEVIEIRQARTDLIPLLNRVPGGRIEVVGETIYCYTDDPQPLTDALREMPQIAYMLRPCTLEDVFLTITGRDLRE
jgi:lipooligosaccharide transport system ATP-binding protein